MNLTKYFDRCFVLNLDNRPDRWEQFVKMADSNGVTGYERYRAVHGDSCQPPDWWRAGAGAWGCLMSHLRLAQDCLMDGLDNYLVFEDDAVFSEDFCERLPSIMQEIGDLKGDWDMLYLGGQHLYRETFPPYPYRTGIVKCHNVNRTHAFAVNARFMVKFSQHIIHAPDYLSNYIHPIQEDLDNGIKGVNEWMDHIDHQLGRIHPHVVTLACNPWLCGQAASSSSINGAMQDEQWWNDTGWGK